MTYDVEVSFAGIPLSGPVADKDLVISSPLPPWVVTADGEMGATLLRMQVGAVGNISETRNGRTVDHAVKVRSVEDLGNGRARVTYEPAKA